MTMNKLHIFQLKFKHQQLPKAIQLLTFYYPFPLISLFCGLHVTVIIHLLFILLFFKLNRFDFFITNIFEFPLYPFQRFTCFSISYQPFPTDFWIFFNTIKIYIILNCSIFTFISFINILNTFPPSSNCHFHNQPKTMHVVYYKPSQMSGSTYLKTHTHTLQIDSPTIYFILINIEVHNS